MDTGHTNQGQLAFTYSASFADDINNSHTIDFIFGPNFGIDSSIESFASCSEIKFGYKDYRPSCRNRA